MQLNVDLVIMLRFLLVGEFFSECSVWNDYPLLIEMDKDSKYIVLWDHYFISQKQKAFWGLRGLNVCESLNWNESKYFVT